MSLILPPATFRRRLGALLVALAFAPGLVQGADVDYAYDEAGRLVGVIAPNGDSAQYVYDAAGNITEIKRLNVGQLAIIEFLPKSGPVGSTVTIWGSGFSTTPGLNTVKFNGTTATVSSATANKLVVTVPAGATTGTVSVTVSATTVTSTKPFTVTPAVTCASRITGFTPAVGVAGASVAISGAGFDAGTNVALFNGRAGSISSATSTTLTATVPSGATSGRLSVSTPPVCGPVNAGDFFVPPSPATASDITTTGRLTNNGSTAAVTLAAGKKALYVFDGKAKEGAGVYLTGNTIPSVTVEIRSPDGGVLATTTLSTATGKVGPVYLPLTGGYAVYVNPMSGSGSVTLQLGAPDLAISNGTVGTITSNQNGSFNIPASFTVTNVGSQTALPNWNDYGFLGQGPLLTPTAVSVGSTLRNTSLAPAASYNATPTYVATGVSPGTYTLFLRTESQGSGTADPNGNMVETSESNNMVSVAVTLPTWPDLAVSNASAGTIVVNQNGTYNIPTSFTVSNLGTNPALASWSDYGYLSASGVLDSTSTILGSTLRSSQLAGGASYNVNQTHSNITASPGNYTLFLKADGQGGTSQASNGLVAEGSETNNAVGVSITLPNYPDLSITSPTVGTITVNQNGTFNVPVTFTVSNGGASASQPNWFDHTYLSSNGALDAASVSIGFSTRTTALAASGSYNVNQTYTTSGINPGNYTLFIRTDGKSNATQAGWVTEANEGNNNASGIAVTLPASPDLVVSNASVGTITKNTNTWNIPITFTVTNSGGSAAQPNWFDYAYLSSDGTLDAGDAQIGNCFRGTALAASANYTITCTYVTPVVSAGSYTVFVKTDGKSGALQAGWVTEGDETNNVTAGLSVTLN